MTEDMSPEDEDRWCAEQRWVITAYMASAGLEAPRVGDAPAWHVAPVLAVWAVESPEHPGAVVWWAVSGDIPCDFTPCEGDRTPRQGLRDISQRWHDAAACWARGESVEGWGFGTPEREREMAPLLAARAALFLEWANTASLWED